MEKRDLNEYTLTTAELAAHLRYHPNHVRLLAGKGKLPGIKRGRAWLFSKDEVLKHLESETKKNAGGDLKSSDFIR